MTAGHSSSSIVTSKPSSTLTPAEVCGLDTQEVKNLIWAFGTKINRLTGLPMEDVLRAIESEMRA
jgi:hypothetical protein